MYIDSLEGLDDIDISSEEYQEIKYKKFEGYHPTENINPEELFNRNYRIFDYKTNGDIRIQNLNNEIFKFLHLHFLKDNFKQHKKFVPMLERYKESCVSGVFDEEGEDIKYYRNYYNIDNPLTIYFTDDPEDIGLFQEVIFNKYESLKELKDVKTILKKVDEILNISTNTQIKTALKSIVNKYQENTFFISPEPLYEELAKSAEISISFAKRLYSQLYNRIYFADAGIYSTEYKNKKKEFISPKFNFFNLYIKDMFNYIHNRNYMSKFLTSEMDRRVFQDFRTYGRNTLLGPNGEFNLRKYKEILEKVYIHQIYCKLFKELLDEYKGNKEYEQVIQQQDYKNIFSSFHLSIQKQYLDIFITSIFENKETIEHIYRFSDIDIMNLSIKNFILLFAKEFSKGRYSEHHLWSLENRLEDISKAMLNIAFT